ncbi:MAG: Jag N-terminal domain-containing protein [Sulfurovaceae bacterium]|nr:Jag N-terminal domain-containing protein [Sulfurovaceae bacterium]MDD5548984.1 Jag N-terminal domain-containing protein [Sulfurovaceae bacterium]
MKKFEAPTLEDAYLEASKFFGCSILELQCEVVQNPANGILGFGKKNAIIVADISKDKNENKNKEIVRIIKEESTKESKSIDKKSNQIKIVDDSVSENFFKEKTIPTSYVDKNCSDSITPTCNAPLAKEIEKELKKLLSKSCFNIDTVEVDVVDNTALIFIDGDDAALLIGKEGYRYNALSYMIFNWLYTKYELFVKLEIARFLTSQKEMICVHLEPIIELVKKNGRAKTKSFDGILVQIALEKLRDEFPTKYVAIKTNKNGEKYIVINDFIQK